MAKKVAKIRDLDVFIVLKSVCLLLGGEVVERTSGD
jgi:hypothetical protein